MGHHQTGFYLGRNSESPPETLQRKIFPWIERAVGEENSQKREWWIKECEKEMREVDWKKSEFEQYKNEEALARVLPDLVAEACQAARRDRDKSANSGVRKEFTAIFGDDDVKRGGLLRLLVRCRRIILQDAAWLDWKARVEKKPVAPILLMHSNIFEDPEFIMFQQRLIVAMQLQKDGELEKLKEAIPSLADVLTRMTERQNQWQRDMDQRLDKFFDRMGQGFGELTVQMEHLPEKVGHQLFRQPGFIYSPSHPIAPQPVIAAQAQANSVPLPPSSCTHTNTFVSPEQNGLAVIETMHRIQQRERAQATQQWQRWLLAQQHLQQQMHLQQQILEQNMTQQQERNIQIL